MDSDQGYRPVGVPFAMKRLLQLGHLTGLVVARLAQRVFSSDNQNLERPCDAMKRRSGVASARSI